jgi:hypothetical protein
MTRRFLFSLIFSLLSISLFSQTWFLKEKGGKFGYVDSLGKVKIPFEYSNFIIYTPEFTDSIAFVMVIESGKSKIKAIDRNNRKLFTVFNFDNGPDYVEEGLFRIIDDRTGFIGFADMNGRVIISPRFFYADSFSEGFAAFNEEGKFELLDEEHTTITGGKWGYIDKSGKVIFPAVFDKAFSFEDGTAEVRVGEYVFYLLHEK